MIELAAPSGLTLVVAPLGARVVSLRVPVGADERREVTVGVDDAAYLRSKHFLGASVGRYANRIARGHLPLDGVEHRLAAQPPGHTLHGGPDGFDKRTWEVVDRSGSHVVLALDSPDGDQGFPGRVRATARYDVHDDGVDVSYTAVTDAPTVLCLTNHTYFHLDAPVGHHRGDHPGDVRDHTLRVRADRWTPVSEDLVPTGELDAVDGTPFDLRRPTRIGDAVAADHPQVRGGIDHNLVLADGPGPQVELTSAAGDLTLTMTTDQPGLQLYTGHGLDGDHAPWQGVALEPQVFPDSPHHTGEPGWTSAVLRPGEDYATTTRWRFRSG